MIFGIPIAVFVMGCVAAVVGLGGVVIVALPVRTAQGVYGKRIAGTMALSLALMLALFTWGLWRAAAG